MKLRERMWLWGHPEGRYNELIPIEKSRMTPMECCLYLGIRNTFMVPVGIDVNRRQYNKSFTTLRHVGWETFKAGANPDALDPFIAESVEFPNINCVVFDDFKQQDKKEPVPVENLYIAKKKLKTEGPRPLDMWMVLYTHEFGVDADKDEAFRPYIEPFDGVIMWNWWEKNYRQIPEKFEIFKKLTPNNRRMFGCYLFDFGESCESDSQPEGTVRKVECTAEAVKWQLDFYLDRMRAGEAEGIVLHTNTMADLDYEAYDAAIEWMAIHGDEEFPDIP